MIKQRGNDSSIWNNGQKYGNYYWNNGQIGAFQPWKSGQSTINRKIDNKIEKFFANSQWITS